MAMSKTEKQSSVHSSDFKAISDIIDYFSWLITYVSLNFVILALYGRKTHSLCENQYELKKYIHYPLFKFHGSDW